ncbi:rod shape-determining protein MreC [Fusibacter sp. JL298sf-3]
MNEKYKKGIVIVVSLLLLVLMLISFGGRERISSIEGLLGSVLMPVQKGLTSIGNFIDEKTEPLLNVLKYKTVNESLSKENALLKEQIVDLTMNEKAFNELKALKKALNYVEDTQTNEFISCDVIAKDYGNWFSMFTINVGEKQGVTKNSAVINGSGLVGLVYEVGPNWSKVISIIDNQSTVGFEMLRATNDYKGVLYGTTDNELIGELFDPQAEVNEGAYIVTSGLGIYPKGILIGQVYEVIEDRDAFLKRIKVKSVVDFKKIDKVMVLPYREETAEEVEVRVED